MLRPFVRLLALAAAVVAPLTAAAQEPIAPPEAPAPPETIPAPDTTARRGPPAPPPFLEADAPRGYEVSLHGIRGFEIGHLNRVDGWTPGFGLELLSVRPNALPTVHLRAGVRTNRPREPWFRAQASHVFPALDRLRLEAAAYRDTHTPDDWKVGARENDFWLFGFRTDLRNYYEANGATLRAATSDLRAPGLALTLLYERNHTLQSDGFFTLTTILGDDEDFRPNPPVREGRVTSAALEARLLTASTQSPSLRVPGWNLSASIERAGRALGGDLSFWRAAVHLRRYTRLAERHWVNARLYASGPVAGSQELPPQRFTWLGGAGSLPGFDTLELGGDRGVLASAEYTFQLPNTSWSTPVFLLWQLEVFANAGNAVGRADRARLYSDLHWDAGAGVAGVTVLGYLGVFAAQRLSHHEAPSSGPRIFFRLQRTF